MQQHQQQLQQQHQQQLHQLQQQQQRRQDQTPAALQQRRPMPNSHSSEQQPHQQQWQLMQQQRQQQQQAVGVAFSDDTTTTAMTAESALTTAALFGADATQLPLMMPSVMAPTRGVYGQQLTRRVLMPHLQSQPFVSLSVRVSAPSATAAVSLPSIHSPQHTPPHAVAAIALSALTPATVAVDSLSAAHTQRSQTDADTDTHATVVSWSSSPSARSQQRIAGRAPLQVRWQRLHNATAAAARSDTARVVA